jgi:hypothetical protein
MTTRQQVRDTITYNHNTYHEKWSSLETPRERFRETQELRDIRDNFIESLDPGLKKSFNDAKEFMKNEHGYVYWNSGWSNCTDYDDILGHYHGVSKWDHLNGDGFDMSEEFTPTNISPKTILLDGFRWFQIRLDKMREVQAAGGLDISHIDGHEKKILSFLEDVKSRNEDLTLSY